MTTATVPSLPKGKSKNYFTKQILFLKICGISLTGNESMTYKLYSFLLLFPTIYGYTVLDFYEMFKHDFETSSNIIIYQAAALSVAIKTTVLMVNRIKFGKLLAKLGQEPFLPDPNRGDVEEEAKLIEECIWKTNVQTYVYWILTFSSVFGSATYTLSTRLRSSDYHDWQFPFGPFTVLNVTYSPNYEISWFYQNFSIGLLGAHFTTIDLLAAGSLAHMSYQFKILQGYLRRIVRQSYKEMLKDVSHNVQTLTPFDGDLDSATVSWKYLQKSVKNAVRHHLAIIDIAKEMEELFSNLLLLIFLVTLVILCFEIYTVSSKQNTFELLRGAMQYINGTCQVVAICYWGEQMMFESQEVGKAAYESNFVGSDVRFQKALVLIIRRSQKPIAITAGKFANICFSTFTWVNQTSYSSFMVIRNSKKQ